MCLFWAARPRPTLWPKPFPNMGLRRPIPTRDGWRTRARSPLPVRVGGFGGVQGLVAYIRDNGISHVIDATHPFASQMSRNAIEACRAAQTPLAALTRPGLDGAQPGDDWRHVPDIDGGSRCVELSEAQRVFLAVGRMHLEDFSAQPQHHYLLRLVDAPDELPLPNADVVVARGPFRRSR